MLCYFAKIQFIQIQSKFCQSFTMILSAFSMQMLKMLIVHARETEKIVSVCANAICH